MNMEPARDYLRSLLEEYGEDPDVADDAPLITSGVLDSLAILKIVVFLEQNYGVDLSDRGVVQSDFDSVSAIMRLIQETGHA